MTTLCKFYIATGEWCSACHKTLENVKEAEKRTGIKFTVLDAERDIEMMKKFFIKELPTFIATQDGKICSIKTGYTSVDGIIDFMKHASNGIV